MSRKGSGQSQAQAQLAASRRLGLGRPRTPGPGPCPPHVGDTWPAGVFGPCSTWAGVPVSTQVGLDLDEVLLRPLFLGSLLALRRNVDAWQDHSSRPRWGPWGSPLQACSAHSPWTGLASPGQVLPWCSCGLGARPGRVAGSHQGGSHPVSVKDTGCWAGGWPGASLSGYQEPAGVPWAGGKAIPASGLRLSVLGAPLGFQERLLKWGSCACPFPGSRALLSLGRAMQLCCSCPCPGSLPPPTMKDRLQDRGGGPRGLCRGAECQLVAVTSPEVPEPSAGSRAAQVRASPAQGAAVPLTESLWHSGWGQTVAGRRGCGGPWGPGLACCGASGSACPQGGFWLGAGLPAARLSVAGAHRGSGTLGLGRVLREACAALWYRGRWCDAGSRPAPFWHQPWDGGAR